MGELEKLKLSYMCVETKKKIGLNGHITLGSTPYRQLENQNTKYHRQQPPV
jgi:hypothetical protein